MKSILQLFNNHQPFTTTIQVNRFQQICITTPCKQKWTFLLSWLEARLLKIVLTLN